MLVTNKDNRADSNKLFGKTLNDIKEMTDLSRISMKVNKLCFLIR